MDIVEQLRKDHDEIFQEVLELESLMERETDRREMVYKFYRTINLLFNHEQNKGLLVDELLGAAFGEEILIDPRTIWGHIEVVNNAIRSDDQNYMKVALENDGRMFISKVKGQMFKEQKFFGRLLLLA